ETHALDNSQVDIDGLSRGNIHSIADAAVSQAARDMLVALFPAATTAADELLSLMLSEIGDSNLQNMGIEIGKAAAAAVLAKRANDPPLSFVAYRWFIPREHPFHCRCCSFPGRKGYARCTISRSHHCSR